MYRFLTFIFAAQFFYLNAVYAQDTQPSEISLQHARRIAGVCPDQWETQNCLRTISESNLVLAATYMEDLQTQGYDQASDKIEQHCAASTAATQGTYPVYAIKSAFTECANMIYDVSEETDVLPDQSHYQLLVGPVLCLHNDRRCNAIEQGLYALR